MKKLDPAIAVVPSSGRVTHWCFKMFFAATRVDLENIILSELSQIEKGKYHMMSLICIIKKNDTNELIYKTEIDSQT